MRDPNFFIIGAPKCGTTSLAAWLSEHPNVYIPVKEPFFFSSDIRYRWIQDFETYRKLFEKAQPSHQVVGEASTFYLFSHVAIPTIEKTFPGARYIAMVRHPVDLVVSLYGQFRRTFLENAPDFETAWRWIPERRKGKRLPPECPDPLLLDYEAWGRLKDQFERLFALVPRERVLVLSLDAMGENPREVYRQALAFLGVEDDGRQHFPSYNPARSWRLSSIAWGIRRIRIVSTHLKQRIGIPPSRGLGLVRFMERMNDRINARRSSPPTLSKMFVKELLQTFQEDLEYLENLLQRPLSSRYLAITEESSDPVS